MQSEHCLEHQQKLADKIEKLHRNFTKDGPTRKTPEYLTTKINDLTNYWEEFNKTHIQLKNYLENDHPYFSEDLYGKTEKIYQTAKQLIENHASKTDAGNNPISTPLKGMSISTSTSTMNTLTTTTQSLPSTAHNQSSNWDPAHSLSYLEASRLNNFPKLPPMKIPKFNGDYKTWKPFIDMFSNIIHENPCLSNVEKMQYLLYHLEGDARKVISHLQLSNNNYNTALHLIQARYSNNRKIITTYINTIMDAKKVEYRCQEDIIMLHDTLRECLEALNNLNCQTGEWGPIIVCITMKKLDPESLRLFEESLSNPREMPTITELLNFLEKRYQVLDYIRSSKQIKSDTTAHSKRKSFHSTFKNTCNFCGKEHSIYQCAEFKKLNAQDRNTFISKKGLCTNCLSHKKTERCKTNKTCFYCNKKHHTLLHLTSGTVENLLKTKTKGGSAERTFEPTRKPDSQDEEATTFHNKIKIPSVLLPTALVRVSSAFGQPELLRALIDPGSQVSLITEESVQKLRLHKERIRTTIMGVSNAQTAKSTSKVNIKLLLPYKNNSCLRVEALVLPKLSSLLPDGMLPELDTLNYGNIVLADPDFNKPGPVDLILGADVYANIVLDGVKQGLPTAQNTKLGWILFGNIPNPSQETNKVSSFLSITEIDQKLEQLWEIGDDTSPTHTTDDCIDHFEKTHKRNKDGRYIVRLPFKKDSGTLGFSKNKAIACLLQMEKKLMKNPNDMLEYNKFLTEYLALGHMSHATNYKGAEKNVYYFPHHAVFKRDSTTTKLRVVFNGSSKTDSGISINDILHTGQKIQQNLSHILLRWRKHRFVFTADIEKMFRQILVAREDRDYQRILWRKSPEERIQEFVLNTVTYGTAPATYLAVRVLMQLAQDEGDHFPIGKRVLMTDFYVDDMLSGADTITEARELQSQIIALLNKGGFNLRKWTSNNEELLRSIPDEIIEKGILEIGEEDAVKTLGIHWNPKRDEFSFKIKLEDDGSQLTKRKLLSKIATIFDPLGHLAPVTVTAKLLMQSLWRAGIDWDQTPPAQITNFWRKFETELKDLQKIRIPRWIRYRPGKQIQIHGFCDASQKACAAVVYSRAVDSLGKVHVTLLAARTKLAPLNQNVTIPRLELCGAHLLAQLLRTTIDALDIISPEVFAWCDSEVVLAWIAKSPSNWHIFVANRVSEIQKLVDKNIWRHVASEQNPADIASRGISPTKLVSRDLWWRGPLWLAQPPKAWPSNKLNIITDEEARTQVATFKTTIQSEEIFTCSTYSRQIRIIAYILRFANNCKTLKVQRKIGYLSSGELLQARNRIIKTVQLQEFPDELEALAKNKPIKRTSKLLSLHPFLDKEDILRVGGRVKNSVLPMDAKHQMLLPQKHHITNTIIDHAHQQTLHGGTQSTLNYIRMSFWIVDGKRVVQGRIHKCIRCARFRQTTSVPLMGNLPQARIIPSPPFSHCGIDYAGPFLTKASKGRGIKTNKGYIALFICLVTKAVHLELVTDLTTDAFLAAYKRFISRRGVCKQIFSDNGTNFVGAKNRMDKELQIAIDRSTKQAAETTANDGTDWKFIPPASPHFGGLWEAGVKSVKGHLKRVLGETLLTYEEFSTVLCQVEACLNSRPIGQQSSDPRDLEPLTPGHFLIGRPLIAPPQTEILTQELHQRWKLVTKLHQDIWKRWSQEYLSLLQQRSKWKTMGRNPAIGELVLVKDDNLVPQKWPLGRITQLHPGDDGVVRIVSVRYKNDVRKRPIQKICQLPISILNDEDTNPKVNSATTMTTLVRPNNLKTIKHSSNNKKRKFCSTPLPEPELWSQPDHFDKIQSTSSKGNQVPAMTPPVRKKKMKIAPCTWAQKLLFTTLSLIYWLTVVFAQDYQLFHPKTGLFLENLGNVQIKRGNLRLQVTLSKEEIISDQRNINSTWNQVREMCEQTKELTKVTHCQTLFQHLSSRKTHLLKTLEEIIQTTEPKLRRRRGILGSLLTSIFGVNDQVYTEIELLQENQKNLLHSANQQSLLLSTKINQTVFVISEKLKNFDARLSQVISSVKEMATWYSKADHNRIGIEVLATFISTEDYYSNLQEKYQVWLNALHNHGHLLNFVSPSTIASLIQNVSHNIGSNLQILPTPQMHLDITAENNSIILHGYLDIVETNMHELIHITPTPMMIANNTFAIADLKITTLAVSFDHQTYFVLDEEELKACTINQLKTYLCTPSIVYSIEESPSCIIDEIYDRHPKTMCQMHQITFTGIIWKKLMTRNTWMYITNESKVAAIICNGSRRELLLNNTGIIHLRNECYLKTKEITLKTKLDQDIDVISTHIKEVVPEAVKINFNKPPALMKPGVLIPSTNQILDFTIQPDLNAAVLKRGLILHSVMASTTALLFILILLVWRYWCRIKLLLQDCCGKRRASPSQENPSTTQESLQQHFNRIILSAGPQHVQS